MNISSLLIKHRLSLKFSLVFLLSLSSITTTFAKKTINHEQLIAQKLDSIRDNPAELRAFLAQMPKGADLHNHLSGAVYAETYLRKAAEDNLCVDMSTLSLTASKEPPEKSSKPICDAQSQPVANVLQNQSHYDALVNAFSMRNFIASFGVSGHDHFFATFNKFSKESSVHMGDWLNEVASRAAAQNVQYLELQQTGDFAHTKLIAGQLGWNPNFEQSRNKLLAQGLREDVSRYTNTLNEAEKLQRTLERCNEPDAAPACKLKIRYLYQILRSLPKEVVFAQALLGFEIAQADPRVVGINLVSPEDGITSMNDYTVQMQMIGYLHSVYPKVHISLHAGELTLGLVPPEGLCCHVRQAIEIAHAERIGHGVDIMYEQSPYALLEELAAKHILIETNLTSNEVILGVEGKNHPFPIERRFGVPLALSTDDEGISRIDLTHEFVRAVRTYDLHYSDLKQLVRASLEHGFLPGISLWQSPDNFTRRLKACTNDEPSSDNISSACKLVLMSSEKAQQQWELEKRFRQFEYGIMNVTTH